MTIQQMMLGSSIPITVNWGPVIVSGTQPQGALLDAYASIIMPGNGTIYTSNNNTGDGPPSTWLEVGSVGDYSVRVVLDFGDTPSGSSLNTWHNASGNLIWTLQTSSGTLTSDLTATLRHNPTGSTWDAGFSILASKGII